MTQEIKDKWLDALKSGRYTQGTGRLRRIDNGRLTYCCLGVLGEVCGLKIRDLGCVFSEKFDHYSTALYPQLEEYISNAQMEVLMTENDNKCDGKYTSVIPIIENITVTE